ncbi:MAG: YIP1 family protein [Clostridiales bacterium]|nr:YIP1 family protein [Clostridiales bacterium]
MKRISMLVLILPMLVAMVTISVAADAPYLSYDATAYKTQVAAPNAYEPDLYATGQLMGLSDFKQPVDFYMNDRGVLYVLEASGRISLLDSELRLLSTIEQVTTADGVLSPLNTPQGLFVNQTGEIYVADSDNSRVLKLSPKGVILQVFERPMDSSYTSETFRPMKVLADKNGIVYVLVEGVYQGVLVYSPEGKFTSFYGSPPVQVTANQLVTRLWKSLLSKEARNNMSRYVPVSFNNFEMDQKGFIYTCSSFTNNQEEQIRKLNYLGNNVYPYTGDFGERDAANYKGTSYITSFVDVEISQNELVFALDYTCGRVYTFDQEGNRLFTFGTLGTMVGAFKKVSAIESFGKYIYVLDTEMGSVTRFVPTAYGNTILEAVDFYKDGQYELALKPWQDVLSMNANYEMAYTGIGQAMMKLEKYEEAVKYFRLGHSRVNESKAFAQCRAKILRQYMPVVLAVMLLLITFILWFTSRSVREKRHARSEAVGKPKDNLGGRFIYIRRVLIRPVETFNEMKFARVSDYRFSAIVIAVLFFTEILARQYYGFRFNANNPETFNILIQLTMTVGTFLLFAVANWAICSISDGDGRFGEIVTFTTYALIPYILLRLISVVLSNVMTLDEQVFLNSLITLGIIWSIILLFQAMRIVHQYSSGKAVIMIIFTLCGMAIILCVLLLLFALFRQVLSFGTGIYSELMYRH